MRKKLTAFIAAAALLAAMMPSAVYAADNRIPAGLYLSKQTATETGENGSTTVTETYYNENGDVLREEVSMQVTQSHVTQYSYSNDGKRLLKERTDYSDGSYNYTDYSYDASGLLVRKDLADSDHSFQILTYEYDAQNRLILTRENNNGEVVTYERSYDDRGNVSSIRYTDTQDGIFTVSYTYDSQDRRVFESEKDPFGVITYTKQYTHDDQNRLSRMVYTAYPEGGYTENYTYSNDAYTVTTTFRDGTTHSEVRSYDDKEPGYTYEYDSFGNVLKAIYTRSETYKSSTLNSYDENGNLLRSVTNDTKGFMEETVNEYQNGKLVNSTTTNSGNETSKTLYEYDRNGFVNRESYSDSGGIASTADYVNDEKGKVLSEKVTDSSGLSRETVYNYDSRGNLSRVISKNSEGLTCEVTYNYDTADQLISMLVTSSDGNAFSAFYTYSNGNLISTVEVSDGETYYTNNTYDKDGKLLTSEMRAASGNEKTLRTEYQYNADGTLKKESSTDGSTVVYEYAKKSPFKDVRADDYFMDAVLWAVEKQITQGTSETTFSPDDACTRAHAVTFLWRASGSPAPDRSKNPFRDVVEGAYYYDAVLWASQNQITKGTSDTTFSPNDTCNRGQIVTFLWRSQNQPAVSGANITFTDVPDGEYFTEAVKWAYVNKVTTGTSETEFSPAENCTRGQIVTFLYRALGK